LQVHSFLAAFVLAVTLFWTAAAFCGDAVPLIAVAPASTSTVMSGPPCVADGQCRVVLTREVPQCVGMEIVVTMASTPPTEDDECQRRAYWLRRAGETQTVLLTEDCEVQIGAGTLGTVTTEIRNCDVLLSYVEHFEDRGCLVRNIGIHLDTLQLFGQTQATGLKKKGKCETGKPRPIRLPHGKGVAGAPVVELNGLTVRDILERRRDARLGR
jgi:hypothetical protein